MAEKWWLVASNPCLLLSWWLHRLTHSPMRFIISMCTILYRRCYEHCFFWKFCPKHEMKVFFASLLHPANREIESHAACWLCDNLLPSSHLQEYRRSFFATDFHRAESWCWFCGRTSGNLSRWHWTVQILQKRAYFWFLRTFLKIVSTDAIQTMGN